MRNFIIIIAAIIFFASCSNKKDPSKIVVDSGFTSYINAFTSGVISSESSIQVSLGVPQGNAVVGEALPSDLFSFEPNIAGEAYWKDNQTIEFRPATFMPSGQTYVGHFQLKKIMAVPSKYESMEFGFRVIKQSLFVSYDGVRVSRENDFSTQELFGTVRTSDFSDSEELQKCFTAKQNGKELDIAWEHSAKAKSHTYCIKGVTRGAEQSEVIFAWNGSPINAKVNDKMPIVIAPLGEFSVMQVRTVQIPGLYFSIQFSDLLDPKQDLAGLIALRSGKQLRFTISNNEIKAYPIDKMSREETIVIDQAVVNKNGDRLVSLFEKTVQFNLEKPAVELIGDGVIMPTVGNVRFPFRAINLKAVNLRILQIYEKNVSQFFQQNQINGSSQLARVGRLIFDKPIDLVSGEALDYGVWNNFSIDLSMLIDPAPGAIYRVMISFEKYQSLYPCGDTVDVKPMTRRTYNFDEDSYFDDELWYEGWYEYSDRDDPCSDSYYKYYKRSVSANFFSSNFGIVAKEAADNNYLVTVTDLRTAEPLSGIDVEAYNFQNVKIGEGKTTRKGIVQFQCSGKPYLIIAKEGKQRGYLRVDNGSALSISLYDVSGTKIKKGVKGFIYGERGVWRPGDTLFLSFVLEDKLDILPETHPIIMELYDPMGKLYDKKVMTNGVNGLYSFKFNTHPKDITGKWQAKVIVGNSSFSKTLKIETIKPNRIRVDYQFPENILVNGRIVSKLQANWLYGAPGSDLRTTIEMNVSPVKTSFKKLQGFMFDDQTKRLSDTDPIEFKNQTSVDGALSISIPFNKPSNSPGMLKLSFNTKVFEPGGDYSQDFTSKLYSPYKSYVGVKMDRGNNWLTALDTEEKNTLAIAAVDEKGNPIDRNVKVEIYKLSWNWWWESDGDDEVVNYINRESTSLIKSDQFMVNNGKGLYTLTFPKAGWGRYLVRIVDEVSNHSCSQIFFGKYSSWYNDNAGGDNSAAIALNIETSKADYNVGEQIEVTLPSGGLGNIFVTVEKGDKIIDQMWVPATPNSTTFLIKATAEMTPNVYINAVLVQPYGQDKNSLPIRMYGVVPVKVFDDQTLLYPVISSPLEVKPEHDIEISVSEKSGRAMAYTLAVVDEGLLSLTHFKTPNAWSYFYAKEALSIRSWDMYKYVMSALTGKMTPILAIGGDEGLNYKEDADANRFKPVVSYLGPFFLNKGDKNAHIVHIPNYIGAVRVMVVSAYKGGYGAAEKEVQVKQPLMVMSTLPRVLGPSEKVKIPVQVICMDDKIKKVSVKVTSNAMLKLIGESQQTITFEEPGNKTIYFDYNVARKLGKATFKVDVSSDNEKAFEEVELLVRAPNPRITTSESKAIGTNESWNKEYTSIGISGSNDARLEISSIPNLDLEKNLNYLIQYPHGCIEQTTSSAFPQLYLSSFLKLSDEQKNNLRTNIIAALNRLKSFQLSSGAFSYWPGNTYPSDWGTTYAGHFMIEAKNRGFDLPPGLLAAWITYQKNEAANWERLQNISSGRWGGDLMQAYRLYTLALSGNSDLGAMNRLRTDPKLSNVAAWRLAASYAIAGRADVAAQLCQRSTEVPRYRDMSYSFGSDVRDMAMILETMYYTKDVDNGLALIQDIATRLNDSWQSTQTRAYALMAIAKYIGATDAGPQLSAKVEVNGQSVTISSETPVWHIDIDADHLKTGNVRVKNTASQIIFVSFVQSGIPVEVVDEPAEKGLNMQIVYQDLQGRHLDVRTLPQGKDFKAIINITHPGIRDAYKEIALNQIFPSGWQIVNTRVAEEEGDEKKSPFTYQDIRDDRVYTYFDLLKSEKKSFEILLNATFVGKYYMPAVFCAPMYDESVQSLKSGQWVEVLKR